MLERDLKNVEILAVLDLSWQNVDQKALPRPYHALSFRLKGDNVFTTENGSVQTLTNDIVLVPKGLGFHQKAGDEKLICIHFSADNVPCDRIVKYSVSNGVLFQKLFCTMYNRWVQKKPGYKNGVISDFYKILSNIEVQQSTSVLSNISDNMHDILQHIHEHFTEQDFCVAKLSQVYNISPSYLRKLFHNHFGVSPIQYITDLRLRYAAELISSHYYKISRVAAMCGFCDTKYFSTVIKKKTGKSPSQLKRNDN